MKLGENILRIMTIIVGVIIIAFNVLLYNFCEREKSVLENIGEQQKTESKVNTNRFKYQELQIEHLTNDLQDAQAQIKDQKEALASQKDALLQEVERRQQIETEGKNVQSSLVDIKAETDAIKQSMKGWQKDYVTVLAKLEKKMEDSQSETKGLEENLAALNIPELKEDINSLKTEIEKSNPPVDNSLTATTPATPDQKTGSPDAGTQQ